MVSRGAARYWGYNTIGFFAPHNEYSSAGHLGQQVQEFKGMVKALHEAGIEVILDVVYNHTAEGNHLGPTLCFRGLDNAAYYRLVEGDLAHYQDYTGTGNSLFMRHPHVLQLIMDSLRYWVLDMHVDGFRFDLAATLAREFYDVDRLASFFDLVQQDPVISQVKLIAEPWTSAPAATRWQLPPLWTEWNGKYRDTVRDFWRGQEQGIGEFASRLTGSSDLYQDDGRRPYASINFITAHDGFTLHDLVSYNDKHNAANGEDNRDGESHNRSWNCGVEGADRDLDVIALREQQKRNFLATCSCPRVCRCCWPATSSAAPRAATTMPTAGRHDILVDWQLERENEFLLDFTAQLARLRRRHPIFRRRKFFAGRPVPDPAGSTTSSGCATPVSRCPTRTGRPGSPAPSAYSSTAAGFPAPIRAASASLTTRSCSASTPTGKMFLHPSPGGLRPELGGRRKHLGAPGGVRGRTQLQAARRGRRRCARRARPSPGLLSPVCARSRAGPTSDRPTAPTRAGTARAHEHLPPPAAAAASPSTTPRRPSGYLTELGVSHLYLSPCLQAVPAPRTATTSSTIPGSARDWAGRRPSGAWWPPPTRPGLGLILDVRPQPHGGQRAGVPERGVVVGPARGTGVPLRRLVRHRVGRPRQPGTGPAAAAGGQPRRELARADTNRRPAALPRAIEVPLAPGSVPAGDPTPDLAAILARQHYRLCHWRVGAEELNYRRFFDITTLAALRVEDRPSTTTHALVPASTSVPAQWTGCGIDHPDGLADPHEYLQRLAADTGGAWIVVEEDP